MGWAVKMINDFMVQVGMMAPIIQAPMAGGVTTVELISAVSGNGGLGSLGAAYLTPEVIRVTAQAIRARTDRPFAINLFVGGEEREPTNAEIDFTSDILEPWAQAYGIEAPGAPGPGIALDRQLEVMLDVAPRVFSFTFGMASPELLQACRSRGILTMGTATTVEEVKALTEAGVDSVCVQGMEAGGHRGTFLRPFDESMIGVMALTSMAVQATHLPVVAAGGLMTGGAIRAVLDLGASAASMGTAFLLCEEAGTSMAHRYMLALEQPRPTVITRAFSGRPARGIINRFHEQISAVQDRCAPFPALNDMTRDIRRAAANAGDPEALSLWAGQAYPLVRDMPAAGLMAVLLDEAKWFGA
ncbi:MAG: nitronate monooxygenase [Hyphomicrobiales bacterium]|nr:nitronate monooxygenase [Hyphomicrobiales bacterium]